MRSEPRSLHLRTCFAAFSMCAAAPAMAGQVPSLPAVAVPVVQCIQHALKSSGAVQSVDLYSIDGFRFAVEYAFRNKEDEMVVSDIELFALDGSVIEGDKIPREVSMETASEAQDLEQKLGLASNCHFSFSFDNLLPQPKARTGWQKLDWPSE